MSNNFRGFGISFSSYPHGDVDSNGLEDLAIGKEIFFIQFLTGLILFELKIALFYFKTLLLGSHLSRHAIVLRRRPSVWVELEINSDTDNINISDLKGK